MSNIKRFTKRGLSVFLALVMCLSLLPTAAFAAGDTNNSTLTKSAFENAYNLGQSDTCCGTVELNGGPITDSGTPNVWATGGWSGAVDVTGYNWVHITNTNPNVATASYTTEGGKLSITFTPGTASGTTTISVGVDAKYPHYSLGTWNMNLNFDYTVTNVDGTTEPSEKPTIKPNANNIDVYMFCDRYTNDKTHYGHAGFLSKHTDKWSLGEIVPCDWMVGYDWFCPLNMDANAWTMFYSSYYGSHMFSMYGHGDSRNDALENTIPSSQLGFYWDGSSWQFYEGYLFIVMTEGARQIDYTVVHEYYTDGEYDGSMTETLTNAKTGSKIYPDNLSKKTDYKDNTYEYKSGSPNPLVCCDDVTANVITLRYERSSPAKTYTVTYTDGVTGETVFPDQGYEDLKEGDKTPAFVGTPTREGYEFMGWEPAVNSVVSADDADANGNITYTATWQKLKITSIKKKLVESAAGAPAGLNTQNTAFPDSNGKIQFPSDGSSVTLLYKITITGDAGKKYTVTDTGSTWVSGGISNSVVNGVLTVNGAIPAGKTSDTIYVTKTFTTSDINSNGNVENTATVTPGKGNESRSSSTETTPAEVETVTYNYKLSYSPNTTDKVDSMPASETYNGPETTHNFTISSTEPTREGYTFQGWADTTNGDVQYKAGETGKDTVTVSSDKPEKTVYAVWTARTDCPYTVEWYEVGKGESFKTDTRKDTFGTKVSVTNEDKKVEGYTFDANNAQNKLEDTLAMSGTVLKLYFTKDPVIPPVNPNGINLVKKVNGKSTENLTTETRSEALTYTITVTNGTNVDLKDMLIRDKMPEGLALTEGSGSVTVNGDPQNVTLNQNDGYCDWTVNGTVPDKGVVVLTYNATVSSKEAVALTNYAKAFAKQVESTTEDDGVKAMLLNIFLGIPEGYEDAFRSNEDNAIVNVPEIEGGDPTPFETVTVTYKDGSAVIGTDSDINKGSQYTVKGLPSDFEVPEGKEFDGWTGDNGKDYSANESINSLDQDLVLTAKWKDNGTIDPDPTKYEVSYEWEGLPEEAEEALPAKETFVEGASVKVDNTYTEGKIITVGEGKDAKTYEFSGWSSEDVTIENGAFTMPDKDVTIIGTWKEQAPNTPTFEDLQDLVKVIVTCGSKATHSEDFTADYSLLADSYTTEENDDGSFTLTINPALYVAEFNKLHPGHEIDSTSVVDNSFTVELQKTVQVSEPESPAPAPEVGDTEEPTEENTVTPVEDADPVEQPSDESENQTTEPEEQKAEVSGAAGTSGWVLKEDEKNTITFTVNCQKAPEITYTVTYTDGVNGQVFANQVFNNLTAGTNTPSFSGTPARQGYTFTGWSPAVADTVTGNATYVAQWRSTGGGSSGGSGNGGGGSTNIPDTPTPLDPGTQITDPDVPLAPAPGLNATDHFAYIIGYPDGTVRPQGNITRAEVATIFFRLMTDEFRTTNWASTNSFPDVASASLWYNNAVSTAAKAGLLKGKEDGNFHPSQNITRAEFATIAARFLSDEEITAQPFPDIVGHWAEKDIIRAVQAGWIKGNSDGNFRPNDPITRAEAMTLVNRMLDRVPDKDHMLSDMVTWPDNPESAWFYEAVQEATNSHDYERDELGVTETWTGKLADRDWSALEKEWSNAASSTGSNVADNLQK